MKITVEIEVSDVPLEALHAARKKRMETSEALARMTRDATIRQHERQRRLTQTAYDDYRRLYEPALREIHRAFAEGEAKALVELRRVVGPTPSLSEDTLIHPEHEAIANARDLADLEIDRQLDEEMKGGRR